MPSAKDLPRHSWVSRGRSGLRPWPPILRTPSSLVRQPFGGRGSGAGFLAGWRCGLDQLVPKLIWMSLASQKVLDQGLASLGEERGIKSHERANTKLPRALAPASDGEHP